MWQLRVARREADEQLAEAKAALARAAADAERVAVREVRRQCAEEYQEQLRAVQQAASAQPGDAFASLQGPASGSPQPPSPQPSTNSFTHSPVSGSQ